MPVYMLANITFKYGLAAEVAAIVGELVPLLERRGWKLVGAYQPIIGDFGHILDVWELESADDVGRVLAEVSADPEFTAIAAKLTGLVENETLEIAVKTSYSP